MVPQIPTSASTVNPIRALADGTVAAWKDDMEENTILLKFADPTPSPNTGNSITILHGDEKVTYCHMQKGSMPAALKVEGAGVKASQVVGLVGNTGNASEPHTHIEAVGSASSKPLRPLPSTMHTRSLRAHSNRPIQTDPGRSSLAAGYRRTE